VLGFHDATLTEVEISGAMVISGEPFEGFFNTL
jgi:hypothetical protein